MVIIIIKIIIIKVTYTNGLEISSLNPIDSNTAFDFNRSMLKGLNDTEVRVREACVLSDHGNADWA